MSPLKKYHLIDRWTSGVALFVLLAFAVLLPATPARATTGIDWTEATPASGSAWYGITFGKGLFVAVSGGASNVVMTSPDGINWTSRTAPN